jgi:uncharacterized protein DUF4386
VTNARGAAWLPLTGILFVALAVIAFIVSGETPDTDDSPAKILAFYIRNDTEQLWAGALLAWGALAYLFFLGALTSVLRAAEGAVSRLSAVAFAGGVVQAIGMLAFAAFSFTLGDTADDGLTPQAAQALSHLNSDFFFPVAIGTGALMIATGLVIIGSRVLPAWLGWVALLIGIAAVTPVGFFGFLLFLVWTLVVSVLLWRAASATAPAPPAAPSATP